MLAQVRTHIHSVVTRVRGRMRRALKSCQRRFARRHAVRPLHAQQRIVGDRDIQRGPPHPYIYTHVPWCVRALQGSSAALTPRSHAPRCIFFSLPHQSYDAVMVRGHHRWVPKPSHGAAPHVHVCTALIRPLSSLPSPTPAAGNWRWRAEECVCCAVRPPASRSASHLAGAVSGLGLSTPYTHKPTHTHTHTH